ncbi:MAG: hypothetical protein GWN67_10260 [Phycisphaerae bacterium]|nr:hypothetical protein [Phycisphaerae bacterium]NIP52481.1 hypothetical protein [Phycisphaerae bacterium]NIS51474.1 hypothetical protein [Phycisphaerae bacterium]NIU08001.1 hypothetical protein [Phycisphaerae bacterium]NIU56746.1 hypothetical protein [Phycisphaerae bacterium]
MPKNKAGLQKQVSSIFTGVPIPKEDETQQPTSPTTKGQPTYGPPSHLSGATLLPDQLMKSSPKAVPPETPKEEEKKAAPVQAPVEIKSSGPSALQQAIERIKDKLFAPKPGVSAARQKATVVLVPVMFIGMILAFYKVLGGGSGSGETPGPKVITPSNTTATASSAIDWKIPELYPTTLRDPMLFKKPEVTPTTNDPDKTTTEEIEIKGIIFSEDNPSVIIGIDILHEGETVSGATIVKINRNSVEFEKNGKKWTQKVQ